MLLEMQEQSASFLPSLCLVAGFSATSIPRPSVTSPFLSVFYRSWSGGPQPPDKTISPPGT